MNSDHSPRMAYNSVIIEAPDRPQSMMDHVVLDPQRTATAGGAYELEA